MRLLRFLFLLGFLAVLVSPEISDAQSRGRRYEEPPQWTWDLGGAFGTYAGYSYSELDLGLNDHFWEMLNWRNMLWDRFGSATPISAVGVDSSVRFEFSVKGDEGSTGFHFFIGPGVRLATNNFTGDFAEAGIIFKFGGLNIGFGVKDLNYFAPAKDPATGLTLPSSDLMYFIILSGGGAF